MMKGKEEGSVSLSAIVNTIKGWIKIGSNDLAKVLIGNPKSTPRFPEIMHAAVFYGNLEMVKHLVAQGCSLTSVPKSITKPEGDKAEECAYQYREAPYIIVAATRGHL